MCRWSILALVMLSGGCGLDARSLTYPGASVYQPSTQDFHFHYLAPPWEITADTQGALIHLQVAATTQTAGTTNYSHRLRVVLTSESSPQQAATAQSQTEQQLGHAIISGPVQISTLTNAVGWDLRSYQNLANGRAYFRETFFTTATSQVVQFSLHSAYPTDEIEIEDLILSYSAGPDPGTPGPDRSP